jgi:two-component system CheB/CheR fusion protein
MGIGLALVKQLAEHHGGRIEGASEGPGKGARFTVWIPLYTRSLALLPDVEVVVARADFSGLRILVVDDDPVTVDSLSILLELEGARVLTATSGADALRELDTTPVDIVLTDVGMPDMDGYQLLAAIRARPGGADLPVIALTGFGRPADLRKADSAGFTGHITKPVAVHELWRQVQAAMHAGRGTSGRRR